MTPERVLSDEEITEAGMMTDEESGNYGPNRIDTPRPWSWYLRLARRIEALVLERVRAERVTPPSSSHSEHGCDVESHSHARDPRCAAGEESGA